MLREGMTGPSMGSIKNRSLVFAALFFAISCSDSGLNSPALHAVSANDTNQETSLKAHRSPPGSVELIDLRLDQPANSSIDSIRLVTIESETSLASGYHPFEDWFHFKTHMDYALQDTLNPNNFKRPSW